LSDNPSDLLWIRTDEFSPHLTVEQLRRTLEGLDPKTPILIGVLGAFGFIEDISIATPALGGTYPSEPTLVISMDQL